MTLPPKGRGFSFRTINEQLRELQFAGKNQDFSLAFCFSSSTASLTSFGVY